MATSSKPTTASANTAIDSWHTAITGVEQNKILIRGYPVDELMGRLSFGDAIYLLLVGDMPSPTVSRIMEALLVSSIDHGAIPPSTIAARTVAGTGAPLRTAAAAGVLALGSPLGGGGSIEACMRFLDQGLSLVGDWVSYDDAARRLLDQREGTGQLPPGYGHRIHKRDPRAARLMQLAFELELEGGHTQLARAVEQELDQRLTNTSDSGGTSLNSDGAIAAVSGDLGLDAETATLLFTISRVPGLVAHAVEEQRRQEATRHIDPNQHTYDGPVERRLPEKPI
ncbi:citryl-CoA lyase [bacterium]|nr:MAG: citryl-CoA lyase [bacterium]